MWRRLSLASAMGVYCHKRTLKATILPKLAPVAVNLRALRTALSSEGSDPAEVGRLLNLLGDQVKAVATSPYGLPIAVPLAQLSLLLNAGGGTLALLPASN